MSRVCVYVVNDDESYLHMASVSMGMLRMHNDTVPVRLIYVPTGKGDPEIVKTYLERIRFMNVQVIEKKPLEIPGEENYFPINKTYIGECLEERVLFIDSDTFISGDVDDIFHHYDSRVVACWNAWVQNHNWTPDLLSIKPINSGVMLWKGELLQEACKEVPAICQELKQGHTPLGEWLWGIGQKCWQREEFSYSVFLDRKGIQPTIFRRDHAWNLSYDYDFEHMEETIIFHSYTHQWKKAFKILTREKKEKNFRPMLRKREFNNNMRLVK